MNLPTAIEMINKYAVCPQCGSEYVGNGEGVLEIEGNTFKRSCKCGWGVEIKRDEQRSGKNG